MEASCRLTTCAWPWAKGPARLGKDPDADSSHDPIGLCCSLCSALNLDVFLCLHSNPFKHMGNSKGGYGKGNYGRGKGGKGMPIYPMYPGMYPGGMRPQGMFGMPPAMGGRGGPYGAQPMGGIPMNSLMYRSTQLQMMHQVRSATPPSRLARYGAYGLSTLSKGVSPGGRGEDGIGLFVLPYCHRLCPLRNHGSYCMHSQAQAQAAQAELQRCPLSRRSHPIPSHPIPPMPPCLHAPSERREAMFRFARCHRAQHSFLFD